MASIVPQLASAATPREVEWLVDGVFPMGRLSIIDGDPGQGKSTLSLEIAAAVSRGQLMTPKGRKRGGTVGNVLVCNAEDDVETTMLPRLIGLEADQSRIFFVDGLTGLDGRKHPLYFPEHADAVDRFIAELKPRLVLIDPIMAFLGPEVRTSSDQSVRHALAPLKDIARRHNCAVILVRHLNKSGGSKALYRGGGSIGIIGLTRSAVYVGPNPEDRKCKIMAQVKNNLGPLRSPWMFAQVQTESRRYLEWRGEADIPLSRILDTAPELTKLEQCRAWLQELLKGGASRPVKEIMVLSDKAGFTNGTLIEAKKRLNLNATRLGKAWYWSLNKK